MRGNSEFNETRRLIEDAVKAIKTLLPSDWDVAPSFESFEENGAADLAYDASLTITAPNRQVVTFLAEVKTGRVEGADRLLERLQWMRLEARREVLLLAQYIGPALRQQCEKRDINYLDLTGWCWIHASAPALAIRAVGAAKDPRPPRATAITRLNGASAGRIIRALLMGEIPIGVRPLAERAAVSAGTVSKVLKELDSEAIVMRDGSGQVAGVKKRLLVARWTRDYSFLKTNNVSWYLAPRGLDQLERRALDSNAWVVETGLSAARKMLPRGVLPITGTSQVALYVPSASETADVLGLVPTDRATANVLLAEPYDAELLGQPDGSFAGLSRADAGQVVADLKTMPGRASQAADQLMDAFAATEEGWGPS